MLEEQNVRGEQRGQNKLRDMEHKIDIVRLNHDKIRQEIKDWWTSRGVKDGEHDEIKAKIQVDLAKVE